MEYEELRNKKIQTLNFRKATMSDFDNIIKIFQERMQWFANNNIKQWSKYLEHHPKDEFINSILKERLFVACDCNQKILGVVELKREDNEFWNDIPNALYLKKLVTDYRYKEIGSYIINEVKNIAIKNKIEFIRLDCLASNKKLNDIYNSYGFKLIKSEIKNYHYNLRELKI